jgi:hypothetical protein
MTQTKSYDYVSGIRIISYYNITPFAGVSGFLNMNYAKVKDAKADYSIRALVDFRYNILSRMVLGTYLEFHKDSFQYVRFNGGVGVSYYIF